MSTTNTSVATRPPPSRWWYVFAVFLGLCGFVFMGAFLVPRILAMGDGLRQVVVPGTAQLELKEPGAYTIFHETESVVDGEVFSSQTVGGLRVKIVSPFSVKPVRVSQAAVSSRYNLGGRSGHAILGFEIDTPGTYRLEAQYKSNAATPRVVLAVGHAFIGELVTTIFGALAFAFAGVAAGLTVAFMTWRGRKRTRASSSA